MTGAGGPAAETGAGATGGPSRGGWLRKRSLALSGHRTSVALEAEFWQALERIAQRDGLSIAGLVERVDRARDPRQPLASVLRLAVLRDMSQNQD